MAWVSPDGRHEGRLAVMDLFGIRQDDIEFETGEIPSRWLPAHLRLLPVCSCGWTTSTHGTVGTFPLLTDAGGRVLFEISSAAPRAEWEAHAGVVEPRVLAGLRVLDELAPMEKLAAITAVRAVLDAKQADAVRVSKTSGRSWSQIGAQLGITKQSVQARYRHQLLDDE